jgi:hypothetical protein
MHRCQHVKGLLYSRCVCHQNCAITRAPCKQLSANSRSRVRVRQCSRQALLHRVSHKSKPPLYRNTRIQNGDWRSPGHLELQYNVNRLCMYGRCVCRCADLQAARCNVLVPTACESCIVLYELPQSELQRESLLIHAAGSGGHAAVVDGPLQHKLVIQVCSCPACAGIPWAAVGTQPLQHL